MLGAQVYSAWEGVWGPLHLLNEKVSSPDKKKCLPLRHYYTSSTWVVSQQEEDGGREGGVALYDRKSGCKM